MTSEYATFDLKDPQMFDQCGVDSKTRTQRVWITQIKKMHALDKSWTTNYKYINV